MRRRAWLYALATTAALGCGGDSSGPDTPEAEGAWSGPVQNNSGNTIATMTLTLTETNGTVTGSGNLSGGAEAFAVTASGTYAPPSLSLTLSALGFENINLTATVGEETMTGALNGSGFINSSITLNRQ